MVAHPLSLKDRQRQERERLILQAAEQVLAEQGYDAMSMEEIASRVGISRAAIYLHFPSKENLILALIQHGIETSAERLDTILAENTSPREKVSTLIERTYGGMAQPSFQAFSAIMHSPTFLSKIDGKRETMRDLWNPTVQRLTTLLEDGKRSGDFDPDMPTSLMVGLLIGLLSPFNRRMVEQVQMPLPGVAKCLARYFLKGIAPSNADKASTTLSNAPSSGDVAFR